MMESDFKSWIMYIVLLVFIILSIIISIYTYFNPRKVKEDIIDNSISLVNDVNSLDEEVEVEELDEYFIDIKGAVANPGVYLVKKGTIINDVITLAGGLKKNASTKYLNLSKETSSEMVIYIYTDSEIKGPDPVIIKEPCNCKTEIIKDCVDKNASIIEANTNKEDSDKETDNNSNTQSSLNLININSASVEELMTLTGIGESKAQAIIEYRNTNGKFNSIEDIKNVSGIGDAAFEKIKDYITI